MTINPVEIIRKKRDGSKLTPKEIEEFISSAVQGTIPEYQIAAFLMATYFQGMDLTETSALTKTMIESGRQVKFDDSRPKVDKHSTGGIGDKISLVLALLVASLDVDVPMVAGRGLGHTGGTLDKLESIPGYRIKLKIEEFIEYVTKYGFAIMGQTQDFVPADKLLYALRDVTATVECVPLITGSILSKKVAEGISGLVLDIKVGSGAFMKTLKDAEKLARSLVAVGNKLGLRVRVILTDMNQPLGQKVGHALEVLETLDLLEGNGPADCKELTIELAAHMLILGKRASSIAAARSMARKNLANGQAKERFRQNCKIQGATIDPFKNRSALKLSQHQLTCLSPKAGYIAKINGEGMGMLLVRMGGGRKKVTDTIDFSVGFDLHAKIGTKLQKNAPLATIYYNPEKLKAEGLTINDVDQEFKDLYTFSANPCKAQGLIKKVIE